MFFRFTYGTDWGYLKLMVTTFTFMLTCMLVAHIIQFLYLSVIMGLQLNSNLELRGILITFNSFLFVFWGLIYTGQQAAERHKEEIKQQLMLEAAVHEAQLVGLKQQLNPHFIFNTLNFTADHDYQESTTGTRYGQGH